MLAARNAAEVLARMATLQAREQAAMTTRIAELMVVITAERTASRWANDAPSWARCRRSQHMRLASLKHVGNKRGQLPAVTW